MGAVEQGWRVAIDQLQATRHLDRGRRLGHRALAYAHPCPEQVGLGCGAGEREVAPLKGPLGPQRGGPRRGPPAHDPRPALGRDALGDGERPRREPCTEHERRVRLQGGQLLLSDVGQRRAEPARVLEPDVRQDADVRVYHAGGVVASSEAGLDDRDLYPALRYLPQRRGRQQFELGDVVILGERAVDALGRPRGAADRGREFLG